MTREQWIAARASLPRRAKARWPMRERRKAARIAAAWNAQRFGAPAVAYNRYL